MGISLKISSIEISLRFFFCQFMRIPSTIILTFSLVITSATALEIISEISKREEFLQQFRWEFL